MESNYIPKAMTPEERMEARRKASAKWRAKNKDKANEATRRWAEANREHRLEQQRAYRRNNRERTRAINKAWREENSEYEYFRKTKSKYGVDETKYKELVERQKGLCPITRDPLFSGLRRPPIDHDHLTGEVRGILSDRANRALGFLKEDPESFYRAVAYLTLDRTKKLVYVIGSLRSDTVPEIAIKLREAGFDAFDNWYSAGKTADDSWQEYSRRKGLDFIGALQSREANHVYRFDKAYLDLSDAVVLVMPAGKSGFLELGYSIGSGKPSYILLDEETENNRYDVMPQFATGISSDLNWIIDDITSYFEDLNGQ